MKPKIVIVGAGISGLALGWFLKKRFGDEIALTILESSDRAGGWIRTQRCGDFLFEAGPRSCRTRGPVTDTLQLIEDLGLEDEVIPASSAAMTRYIYTGGLLEPVPNTLFSFLTSSLMTGVLPALWHECRAPQGDGRDETIANFIRRRFGLHIAKRFVDPLVSGIYAGDIEKLSMRACFPDLFHLEQQSGSIIKGMLKGIFKRRAHGDQSRFIKKMLSSPIFSFREGMETLTRRLQEILCAELKMRCRVASLDVNAEGIDVMTDTQGILQADHVFLALPVQGMASIFRKSAPFIADQMSGTSSASVAVVNIGWKDKILKQEGFGYLIPTSEHEEILGVVWDSSVFPQQNSTSSQTRLTVMMGGAHHPGIENSCPDELVNRAVRSLSKHLGIAEKPDATHVAFAKEAIPQYTVDHHLRVKSLEEAVSTMSGSRIHLVGSALHGVSIHNCISNAKEHSKSITGFAHHKN